MRILIALLFLSTIASAETFYCFRVDPSTDECVANYKSDGEKPPLYVSVKFKGKIIERINIFVTKEQSAAGWDALDPQIKAQKKAEAMADKVDYDKWTGRDKKMLRALIKVLNKRFQGNDKITKKEMKEALEESL